MNVAAPSARPHVLSAVLLAAGMALTVGTALAFQHLGGFIPCKLCLEQRTPYYIGIPVALAAAAFALSGRLALVARGFLAVAGLLMLWGLGLGVYHSGVEWGWWAGPADCGVVAGGAMGSAASLLDQLNAVVPPSCDEAAGRFLGLSFAGWNVLASAILAAIAFRGASRR